ncbi:MAG: hypothetical protein U0795_11500 [Pirellulales bacterium]
MSAEHGNPRERRNGAAWQWMVQCRRPVIAMVRQVQSLSLQTVVELAATWSRSGLALRSFGYVDALGWSGRPLLRLWRDVRITGRTQKCLRPDGTPFLAVPGRSLLSGEAPIRMDSRPAGGSRWNVVSAEHGNPRERRKGAVWQWMVYCRRPVIAMVIQPNLRQMEYPKSILVDCGKFGTKELKFPESVVASDYSARLTAKIESDWDTYWDSLFDATSEMADQVQGIYDFDASFDTHKFNLQIYHFDFSPGTEHFMIRVEFIDSDSQVMCPVFDTTFQGLAIVHSQPVF